MPQLEIDLTTVATAAGEVGASAGDAVVQRLVSVASRMVANHLGYAVHRRAGLVETVPGHGVPLLFLRAGQLVSVQSIELDGAVIASSGYVIESALFGRIRRVGASWPFTGRSSGGVSDAPLRAADNGKVKVSFTAGWVTPGQNALLPVTYPNVDLPEDIQQAAIETFTALWRRRGQDQGIASRALGGGSIAYRSDAAGPMAPGTKALLAPYRRIPGAF